MLTSLIASKGDIAGNWIQLEYLVAENIPGDDGLAYRAMLRGMEADTKVEFGTFLGFRRTPAARGNHHDYEGGLVYHLLEMWSIWQHLRPGIERNRFINDERVLKAIINHDLHKAYKTFLLRSQSPWSVEYADDSTDMLMTSDVKSIWLLSNYGIKLDPEQMNALLLAEGGYAKIRPRWSTVLSKLCYTLDELSGNVIARADKRTYLDLRTSERMT